MKKTAITVIAVLLMVWSLPCRAQYSGKHYDNQYFETYLQYAPYAVDLGIQFAGAKTDTQWYDRLIKGGVAVCTELILSNSLKAIVTETRPDGRNDDSFPSGHTATAFAGAELVRQDYGGWWGAGAYAAATTVGVLRVVHKRHYWWDALAGAGLGVLSAQVGRWTLEPIKKLFGINSQKDLQLALTPVADPYSGACCAALVFTF